MGISQYRYTKNMTPCAWAPHCEVLKEHWFKIPRAFNFNFSEGKKFTFSVSWFAVQWFWHYYLSVKFSFHPLDWFFTTEPFRFWLVQLERNVPNTDPPRYLLRFISVTITPFDSVCICFSTCWCEPKTQMKELPWKLVSFGCH
jgi:hypothetical protein